MARAKRALPASFKQKSTKSGATTVVKKSNLSSGSTGKSGGKTVKPGGVWKPKHVLQKKK